jgi:uncharacterized membrane protein YoaK (UPF0700 family)
MTGSTTQVMIDLADILRGETEGRAQIKTRLARTAISIGAFALGCAAAALLFAGFSVWCFLVPPVLAAAGLVLVRRHRPA